jgi:hypothetical protein
VQIIELDAFAEHVVEIEIQVVGIAQHNTLFFLSKSLMPAPAASVVHAFHKGVVAGEELITSFAAARPRDLDKAQTGTGAPGKKGEHAVLRHPLAEGAAGIEIIDLGWSEATRKREGNIFRIHRQTAAETKENHPLFRYRKEIATTDCRQ